jgi:hypothetical protein
LIFKKLDMCRSSYHIINSSIPKINIFLYSCNTKLTSNLLTWVALIPFNRLSTIFSYFLAFFHIFWNVLDQFFQNSFIFWHSQMGHMNLKQNSLEVYFKTSLIHFLLIKDIEMYFLFIQNQSWLIIIRI